LVAVDVAGDMASPNRHLAFVPLGRGHHQVRDIPVDLRTSAEGEEVR
jgi:hypothetical protein